VTTKLHLASEGRGLPLAVTLTGGQRQDRTQLQPLLDAIRVPRAGPGRPRKRPDHLIADKGYSYPACRRALRRRGIQQTIPERRDQRERWRPATTSALPTTVSASSSWRRSSGSPRDSPDRP